MDNKEMERNEEMVTENTSEETMEYDNIPFEKDAKVTVEDADGNVIAEAKPTDSVDEDGFNEEAEDKKLIYHITHNDADAIGCAIVADCIKGYETMTLFCSYSSVDEDVRNVLINNSSTQKDGKLIFPDILLISDISALGDETITFIENYKEAALNEGKDVKLVWVDHHASNRRNETLEWCTVISKDSDGTPVSAAKLLYNIYIDEIEDAYKKYLGVYVESVSRYDTWEWKKHPSNYSEEYTNILIKQMGIIDAYHAIGQSLLGSVSSESESFTFVPEASVLISTYINKRKQVLDVILDKAVKTEFAEYNIALLIPDSTFFNECMEHVYLNDDDVDIVIGLSPSTRAMSFRSNKEDLNLGRFAKKYFGGGGHPQAAGANDIDTETFVKWLCKYYNGIDYVNSKEYKKKEKKAAKKAAKKNK